jgi:hypothetical protein
MHGVDLYTLSTAKLGANPLIWKLLTAITIVSSLVRGGSARSDRHALGPARNNGPLPLPPSLVTSLRAEIVETQKTGADFVKWKLIATATVASLLVGVGRARLNDDGHLQLLICLIPLICAYVDLVSSDLAIRILAIAAFLRDHGDVYERWVQPKRSSPNNPWAFAPIAIHGSSLAICLLILAVGIYGASVGWETPRTAMYFGSGAVGALVAWVLRRAFIVRVNLLP